MSNSNFECKLCIEPLDHLTHKPYSLYPCGHTYCISCIQKLSNPICPLCREHIHEKIVNFGLLEFIPQTNEDVNVSVQSPAPRTTQVGNYLKFNFPANTL